MTQLILDLDGNAIYLPESVKRYQAWEEDGGAEVEMISRRMVRELRGNVWRISYQYGWFNDADKALLIGSCTKGRRSPIRCAFLPPNSNELQESEFFVMSFTWPKFQWSRIVMEDGEEKHVPVWADLSLELREVRPHD